MLKKKLMNFCLSLGVLTCFEANASVDTYTIDYGQFPTIASYGTYDSLAWTFGAQSFNHAPELLNVFALIKQFHQIEACVETGTFLGSTTRSLAFLFDEVHTIEIVEANYSNAKELLKESPNVTCHLGSSEQVLREILPSLEEQRVLFYLDAHWNAYWPLLDELKEISKTHKDNCVIVIDDFKIPGRPDIPYDAYSPHECSYEYIKEQLDNVLSSYDVLYVIPKNIACRAKFVAIPKQWQSEKAE